ncbi:MAG TPA: SDR family oxidoreductase [Mycobacteriales bacterium]|nr:SDR family oxidoreductase [Mycobacteriales bacterium]
MTSPPPAAHPAELFSLRGRTAVVTGASAGLGRRFAGVLAAAGATVIAAARRADRLAALAAEHPGIRPVRCDVADEADRAALVAAALAATGRLDILVNNAGIGAHGAADGESPQAFRQTLEVNLVAPFHLACLVAGIGPAEAVPAGTGPAGRAAAEIGPTGAGTAKIGTARIGTARIGTAGVGTAGVGTAGVERAEIGTAGNGTAGRAGRVGTSIVNVASILGLVSGAPLSGAGYAASKAGLIGLTRELAAQWGRRGVRVNALAPGWFRSEMTSDLFADQRTADWVTRNTVLRRAGEAGELDGALLFLASDASSYTTGQVLIVDGGWTAR